jgi:hypothetical protein
MGSPGTYSNDYTHQVFIIQIMVVMMVERGGTFFCRARAPSKLKESGGDD